MGKHNIKIHSSGKQLQVFKVNVQSVIRGAGGGVQMRRA